MQILVIGGTGFIGSRVVGQLTDRGHNVTVFHRGETNADFPPGVHHIFGHRHQLSSFASDFKRISPHVVIDMFLYTEEDATSVVRAFRGIAERLVAISSQDVYKAFAVFSRTEPGQPHSILLNEDRPLKQELHPFRSMAATPDDQLYNYDKALVEAVVMADAQLSGTVLRLPAVYGIGDKQHRLFEYLKRMDDDRPVILLDENKAQWRWTRGYVDNVAAAIILAALNNVAENRIYNVGELDALSEAQWVRAIGEVVGWNGDIVRVPRENLPSNLQEPNDWRQHMIADTTRIRTELGYKEAIPRELALGLTVDWERENSPSDIKPERFDYAAEDELLRRLEKVHFE